MTDHPDFERLVGAWAGTWQTWVEPDQLHDSSPMAADTSAILGGAALLYRYTGSIRGDAVEGVAVIGARQGGDATLAWADTWHTSGLLTMSEGIWTLDGLEVATIFDYSGQEWTWTTRLEVAGDRLTVRHWNEGPGVPRYLGVEAILDRV